MNKERIKELYGAAVYAAGKENQFSTTNLDMAEKLVELVVRECLQQVEDQYKPVLEDKEMMKDPHWDGYVQCGVDSYVAIKEHFFRIEE